MIGFTKVVALEGAELGITSNAICPGYVWTPLLQQSIDFEALRTIHCKLKLNLCATNVRTGRVKVFSNDEINCIGRISRARPSKS